MQSREEFHKDLWTIKEDEKGSNSTLEELPFLSCVRKEQGEVCLQGV